MQLHMRECMPHGLLHSDVAVWAKCGMQHPHHLHMRDLAYLCIGSGAGIMLVWFTACMPGCNITSSCSVATSLVCAKIC